LFSSDIELILLSLGKLGAHASSGSCKSALQRISQ
jgi:hypothetical protein